MIKNKKIQVIIKNYLVQGYNETLQDFDKNYKGV